MKVGVLGKCMLQGMGTMGKKQKRVVGIILERKKREFLMSLLEC
jgi:hypothetical protein